MIIPNSTFSHATHIEYYRYRLLLITFTAGRDIPNFSTEYCPLPTFLMPYIQKTPDILHVIFLENQIFLYLFQLNTPYNLLS